MTNVNAVKPNIRSLNLQVHVCTSLSTCCPPKEIEFFSRWSSRSSLSSLSFRLKLSFATAKRDYNAPTCPLCSTYLLLVRLSDRYKISADKSKLFAFRTVCSYCVYNYQRIWSSVKTNSRPVTQGRGTCRGLRIGWRRVDELVSSGTRLPIWQQQDYSHQLQNKSSASLMDLCVCTREL